MNSLWITFIAGAICQTPITFYMMTGLHNWPQNQVHDGLVSTVVVVSFAGFALIGAGLNDLYRGFGNKNLNINRRF